MRNLARVVVAADSFKGSLSSIEVARSAAEGIRSVFPDCRVVETSVADGGEGSVAALVETLAGRVVEATVGDPLGRPVVASYGIVDAGGTAVIEMASASGLTLLDAEERNPMKSSTFGTGELIADALRRGCRKFLICIGGSATNDAGTGMLRALGYKFFDRHGHELMGTGGELISIASIDPSGANAALSEAEFRVACDVDTPFCGVNGAARVFAPQKGATPEMVEQLDQGLRNFAQVVRSFCGIDIASMPKAGAAGGLGGGFKALLGATLLSGVDMVLDAIGFDQQIAGSDLIITGEGRLDAQTLTGKTPLGVLHRAQRQQIPVIAIGGSVEESERLNEAGFTAVFPILPSPVTLSRAMEKSYAADNVRRTAAQIMRTIKFL